MASYKFTTTSSAWQRLILEHVRRVIPAHYRGVLPHSGGRRDRGGVVSVRLDEPRKATRGRRDRGGAPCGCPWELYSLLPIRKEKEMTMSKEQFKRLGKYELQQRLGQGGMAEVWKALDTQLQRYVAIKVLHANLQEDPNFITRFEQEAQLIASLHHPNIVQIHDFQVSRPPESPSTIAYMVMAYIEGQTFADYIGNTSARGKIPSPTDLVNLFTSISLAIDYAPQTAIIHPDTKPSSVLLDKHNTARNPMGEPILTDFGLAKLLRVSAGTMTVTQLVTPLYTSPEQARGYPGNEP